VAVTPIGLATMVATVANGGTLVTPHLARAFDNGDGRGWQLISHPAAKSRLNIDPANLQAVRDGLWRVVNATGTGRSAQVAGHDVAGKTGTAQANVSLRNRALAASRGVDVRDHRWFVFFAPRDNPQIAGAIFAEHGGAAGSATPIARYVLETFFAKREGRPMPTLGPGPGLVIVPGAPAEAAQPATASQASVTEDAVPEAPRPQADARPAGVTGAAAPAGSTTANRTSADAAAAVVARTEPAR
jgi:penicillin-binding protein 2